MERRLADWMLNEGCAKPVGTSSQSTRSLSSQSEPPDYFADLVAYSSHLIVVFNADGTIRYASPAQTQLFGYPQDTFIGRKVYDLVHPADRRQVQLFFAGLMHKPAAPQRIEFRVRHQNGDWRNVDVTATNLLAHPTVQGILVNAHDVTQHKRLTDQLVHDAFHDALTGLPNRALLLDRLGKTLERGKRIAEHHCAVLVLDLDRFKTINDGLGHSIGDGLLVEVGRRIASCVRPGDTVARSGGDEFVVLLEEVSADCDATVVAERIANVVAEPIIVDGHIISITISIGIGLSNRSIRPDTLVRDAGLAMYRAKLTGGGTYAVVDPAMHVALLSRMQIENDLRRALQRNEFLLYYQPIVGPDGNTITGVEALIRWMHPTRGLVMPSDFIPIAEETGLIIPIGNWVLREACKQFRLWLDQGIAPKSVSVNLSALQLKQPTIIPTIHKILKETGVDAHYLEFEITESVLMEDVESTLQTLHALHASGIDGLAIDDFATGYSSLRYLQRFPVTTVKIDRSFVRDVRHNPQNAAIVTALLTMARGLNLQVIAEGVETEEERTFLAALGCKRFQGYFFSQPVPPDTLILLLQNTRTFEAVVSSP